MGNLIAKEYQGFEQIKHTDDTGNEYWLARELAEVLEYSKWENFNKVIDRAMLDCRNSGFNVADQFLEVSKLIEMPSKPRSMVGTCWTIGTVQKYDMVTCVATISRCTKLDHE